MSPTEINKKSHWIKSSLLEKFVLRETILYFCIGTSASLTDSALYILFTRQFGIWYLFANFMSVNIGVTLSFLLNSFVNFKKTQRMLRRALSFFGVCYLGMIFSMVILFTGTKIFGFADIPVKICSVIITGIFQFLFNKFVTFGKI